MTERLPDASRAAYSERLRTPFWWYFGAIAVAAVLGAEFAFAVSGWLTWVPLLVLIPVCMLVVWRLSAARIAIVDSELVVPGAQLQLSRVDRAIELSASELRRLVGRHSNPIAFVYIRSWVGPGVQLILNNDPELASDPELAAGLPNTEQDDPQAQPIAPLPVPYWVVSTRHPDRLLAAVSAAMVPTI